jgi:hypothetical protein
MRNETANLIAKPMTITIRGGTVRRHAAKR